MAEVKKKYRVVLTSISNGDKSYPEGSEIDLTDEERKGLENFTVLIEDKKSSTGENSNSTKGKK